MSKYNPLWMWIAENQERIIRVWISSWKGFYEMGLIDVKSKKESKKK